MHPVIGRILGRIAVAVVAVAAVAAHAQPLGFGVINQRSVALTAASWNPILAYINKKAGVQLALRMGKTAPETTAMTERGEHAFAFSNHMFTPERDKLGYKAILRLQGPPVSGVIVVRDDSAIRAARDLNGLVMAFPSREAFLGYQVPTDHLASAGVTVKEVFAGNQEGAMAQLQVGQVAAAAVNKSLLEKYTQRQDFAYRVLWTSEPYQDIPIMVHPAVPPAVVEAVRRAFLGMAQDPEGRKALQASADAIQLKQPWSFVPADDRDYDNYRRFYRRAAAK
jgi:phosphonate transport system substrate-binding protein